MTKHPNANLETALTFVIDRIAEEAERTGAPLDDQERDFLRHLPRHPTNPTVYNSLDGEPPFPRLRDFSFETLCTLAKDARLHDLRTRPDIAPNWEFAAAVFQLENHPMSWLLAWSGLKKRRPRWDRLLLVGTAVLILLAFMLIMLGASALIDRLGQSSEVPLLIAATCAFGVVAILLFVAAQRREKRALTRIVEKFRADHRS